MSRSARGGVKGPGGRESCDGNGSGSSVDNARRISTAKVGANLVSRVAVAVVSALREGGII